MDVNQLTGLAVDRLAAAIISGDFSEKKTRTFDFLAILCRCTFSERVIPRAAVERWSERDLLSDNRQTIRIMSDFHLLICAIF